MKMHRGKIAADIGEVRHEALQLLGLAHFISHYDPREGPIDLNERFWGLGSTMEEKLEKILQILDVLDAGGKSHG